MQKLFFLFSLIISSSVFAQEDTSVTKLMSSMDEKLPSVKPAAIIFYSQKLINANTVEVLRKGILEFKVVHNFGDIAGDNGGAKSFYGLDNATDVKIAFQAGLTKKLNVFLSRTKGGGNISQLIETGIKYQFLQQLDNDPNHPISVTLFANNVISAMQAHTDTSIAQLKIKENHFTKFSDRMSQVVQIMIARKFGKMSLQLSPTYVHTNYVVLNDQKNLFALGAGIRLPLSKKFVLIADYFHAFRSKESEAALTAQYDGFYDANRYDAFGIGVEIVTPGHLFHLNFTNTTNILENRFIPRTYTSLGKGQYRWGFTIARDFVLFRDKK
jgi:Membrane bound beta barrel domain (DUF5777)